MLYSAAFLALLSFWSWRRKGVEGGSLEGKLEALASASMSIFASPAPVVCLPVHT